MDSPPTRTQDGNIVTGILSMQYNETSKQLLTLGLDRRVSYWNIEQGKVGRQL